jgi:hypothetical protein
MNAGPDCVRVPGNKAVYLCAWLGCMMLICWACEVCMAGAGSGGAGLHEVHSERLLLQGIKCETSVSCGVGCV